MRYLTAALVALVAQAAAADTSLPSNESPITDRAFRRWATAVARKSHREVVEWWAANLDHDPGLERAAILCADDGEKGALLIEKDAAHRWIIPFQIDGRTWTCEGGRRHGPPVWERRRERFVTASQGHHHGSHTVDIALRQGIPVIVREHYVEDVYEPVSRSQEYFDADLLQVKDYFEATDLGDLNSPFYLGE